MTILDDAADVIDQREAAYGDPTDNLDRIAGLWSTYLDKDIDSVDVSMLMILMKVARHKTRGKLDNLVDICGYARLAEIVEDKSIINKFFTQHYDKQTEMGGYSSTMDGGSLQGSSKKKRKRARHS